MKEQLIETVTNGSCIGKKLAVAIAESQTDLGGKSKEHLITALSSPCTTDRIQAVEKLDDFSCLVAYVVLEHESFDYYIDQLTRCKNVMTSDIFETYNQ